MIKDIIIHVWGEAERNLSVIPAALKDSGNFIIGHI